MKPPGNQLQYKPESTDEGTNGRTLGQFDPMVWMGVAMMLLGFALLLVMMLLFHVGGWL